MIVVENLEKSFGDVKILKGISTSFEKGKTNLIIGQSGSGKTVFLKNTHSFVLSKSKKACLCMTT